MGDLGVVEKQLWELYSQGELFYLDLRFDLFYVNIYNIKY